MRDGFRRASPPREHRPPRDFLYTKHFVALADYARDYKSGLVQSYAKLSKDEKKAKFGVSIVPIFVPLAPGETAEQYEARFVAWLQRKQGLSLADVRKDPDETAERVLRIRFAGLNGTGAERFQPETASDRKTKRDGASHKSTRSPSPSSSRRVHSSRGHKSSDSLSPTRAVSRDHAARRSRNQYYVKKYVELDQYIIDYKNHKIDGYMKLTEAERLELFGSPIVPIHVPLARGESMRQYEERFIEWLREQGVSLDELANDTDLLLERNYRVKFANLNAKGVVGFRLPTRKRARSPSKASPRPEKKPVAVKGETQQSQHASEGETQKSSQTPSTKSPITISSTKKPLEDKAHGDCIFVAPPADASTSLVAAAYIECGCRQCLVQGMRHLSEKISELDRSSSETGGSKSPDHSKTRSVVDLTEDDDPQSPKSPKSKSSLFADAVARLLSAPETAADLQKQVSIDPTKTRPERISDDPVQNQLVNEYQTINERVLNMETQLSDLAARLASTSATHTSDISRLQNRSQKVRDAIQKEWDDRSAALAMLVVYMWRQSQEDLTSIIDSEKVVNVLHIQRSSHKKCSVLSTTINEIRTTIIRLKAKIDCVMNNHASPNTDTFTSHLDTLTQLGEQLTAAEKELCGLVGLRKREITNIIRYDEKLRLLIKTLLTSGSC